MLHSQNVWLVPAALILASFGFDAREAIAQTTYEFEAVYSIDTISRQITPDISEATTLGMSADAPYGLTNLRAGGYVRLDPITGVSTFVPDAAEFGLEGLPILLDMLSGSSDDSLVAYSTGTAVTDFENLTVVASGIFTITGGSGRFSGASGTLSLNEKVVFNPDSSPPIAQALLSGSFQTPDPVPEPRNAAALAGISVLGMGFLLRQCRNRNR